MPPLASMCRRPCTVPCVFTCVVRSVWKSKLVEFVCRLKQICSKKKLSFGSNIQKNSNPKLLLLIHSNLICNIPKIWAANKGKNFRFPTVENPVEFKLIKNEASIYRFETMENKIWSSFSCKMCICKMSISHLQLW